MSVFKKIMTTGLVALTLGGAAIATSTDADAHWSRGSFWGGIAAGTVGGVLLSQAARPAYPVYPAYRPVYGPPVYPVYERPAYCHFEWRYNSWGDRYRVEVCPR